MRISQLKNLCWAGNGLVFLGVGFVVFQFVETYKTRGQREEVTWPEKASASGIEKRWPGSVRDFTHIWDTPVNGEVPVVVVPDKEPPKKRDEAAEFRAKTNYVTGLTLPGALDESVALVSQGAAEPIAIRTGAYLGEWQLVGFRLKKDPEEAVARTVLVFYHPDASDYVLIEQTAVEGTDLLLRPWDDVPDPKNAGVYEPEVLRDKLDRQAYQRFEDRNHWIVPFAEVRWWEKFGESEVLNKLSVAPKTDAEGHPIGLEIRSSPTDGTVLKGKRGVSPGETLKSLNGVPIHSKEDLVRYLRGDGRGLDRYEAVIESAAGEERTVVYEVARRRGARGKTTQ